MRHVATWPVHFELPARQLQESLLYLVVVPHSVGQIAKNLLSPAPAVQGRRGSPVRARPEWQREIHYNVTIDYSIDLSAPGLK